MSTGAIVAIIIGGVVVVALAAFLARLELRRRHLRDRFGPEYDRIREDSNGRRDAEHRYEPAKKAQHRWRYQQLDLRDGSFW